MILSALQEAIDATAVDPVAARKAIAILVLMFAATIAILVLLTEDK